MFGQVLDGVDRGVGPQQAALRDVVGEGAAPTAASGLPTVLVNGAPLVHPCLVDGSDAGASR